VIEEHLRELGLPADFQLPLSGSLSHHPCYPPKVAYNFQLPLSGSQNHSRRKIR
jgi:hypothetical protein